MAATLWHWAPLPFAVHAAAMLADEAWYHRRRGLPRWERWGHPADTATVLLCYLLALALDPSRLWIYALAAAFSTLFITKDEWVHARTCTGGEMWLHAFLFSMHPVLLFLAGYWRAAAPGGAAGPAGSGPGDGGWEFFGAFLAGQAVVTGLFLLWQAIYWNGPWAPAPASTGPASIVTSGIAPANSAKVSIAFPGGDAEGTFTGKPDSVPEPGGPTAAQAVASEGTAVASTEKDAG